MVERGGRISAHVVDDISALTMYPWIRKYVKQGTRVITDQAGTYVNLPYSGFEHDSVKHADGIYVDGDVHTQTIENFWMLVKNGIKGAYHQVSPKHLQGYLNEYVWRYNHREDDAGMFLQLLLNAAKA